MSRYFEPTMTFIAALWLLAGRLAWSWGWPLGFPVACAVLAALTLWAAWHLAHAPVVG